MPIPFLVPQIPSPLLYSGHGSLLAEYLPLESQLWLLASTPSTVCCQRGTLTRTCNVMLRVKLKSFTSLQGLCDLGLMLCFISWLTPSHSAATTLASRSFRKSQACSCHGKFVLAVHSTWGTLQQISTCPLSTSFKPSFQCPFLNKLLCLTLQPIHLLGHFNLPSWYVNSYTEVLTPSGSECDLIWK